MKIKRILNNNAVVSINDEGEEVVVFGLGIAFRKKVAMKLSRVILKKYSI